MAKDILKGELVEFSETNEEGTKTFLCTVVGFVDSENVWLRSNLNPPQNFKTSVSNIKQLLDTQSGNAEPGLLSNV